MFTYAEMDLRSDALAAGRARHGVARGERMATLAPNRTELLEPFYGVAETGGAQVPSNVYLKGEFLLHQLRQSRSGVLLTETAGRVARLSLRSRLSDLRAAVMLDDAQADEIPYSNLFDHGQTPPPVDLTAADTMSIRYTSRIRRCRCRSHRRTSRCVRASDLSVLQRQGRDPDGASR